MRPTLIRLGSVMAGLCTVVLAGAGVRASTLAPVQLEGLHDLVPYVRVSGDLESAALDDLARKARASTAARLAKCGIGSSTKHGEALEILVYVLRVPETERDLWVVETQIAVREEVAPLRNAKLRTPDGAWTWLDRSTNFVAAEAELSSEVLASVQESVEYFLGVWSAENGREKLIP